MGKPTVMGKTTASMISVPYKRYLIL